MSTKPQKVAYAAHILLQDAECLLESFAEDVGEGTVESALMHYLTQVDKRPQEAGYQVLRRTLEADSQGSYTLKVTGLITDETKFKAEYVECTNACFGRDEEMAEQSLSAMLGWVLTVANASDSPANLGFAIVKILDAEPHRPPANEPSQPSI